MARDKSIYVMGEGIGKRGGNFMTTIGESRVLPEDLAQSAARLRPVFARLAG